MLSMRFIFMLLFSPIACGIGVWRPRWGLYLLVAQYYFRPDVWAAPPWFRPHEWIVLSVTLGWLLQMKPIRFGGLMGLSSLLLFGSLVGSFTAAVSTTDALQGTEVLLKIMWLQFLALQLLETPKHLNQFLWANVLAMAWNIKSILHQGIFGDGRVSITLAQGGGANYIATILVMTLPFFVMKIRHGARWERRYSLVFLPLYVLCAVFTGSRGGLLGLGAVVLYLILLSRHKVMGLAGGAVLAVAVLLLLPDTQKERFLQGMSAAGLSETQTADASAEARLKMWGVAWQLFKENPVLGVGTENFHLLSARRSGLYHRSRQKTGFVTHNTYLQVLAEGGLAQAGPFFGLFILSFVMLRRLRKLPLDPEDKKSAEVFSISVAGLLVGFCVTAMFVSYQRVDYIWWYLGAIEAATMVYVYRAIQSAEASRAEVAVVVDSPRPTAPPEGFGSATHPR